MARAFWHAEFEWRLDHVRVRDTGAVVPISWPIVKETLAWMTFYVAIQPVRLFRTLFARPIRVSFAPSAPAPWYLLWATCRAAGARFTPVEASDVVFYFEDATVGAPPRARVPAHARRVNFHCTDVSKSRVAAVFEEVFGYPLAVNPEHFQGPCVEKGEANGVHDGRVVQCPAPRRPGKTYQRLVDTIADDGLVEDIRCPTILGEIPVAFIKRRPAATRFANANSQVRLVDPADVLRPAERARIAQFAAAMGLEWGGVDVLRDRRDGRLYIVDVNKTDMGPPTALNLLDQMRAALRLARAFRRAFGPDSATPAPTARHADQTPAAS